MTPPILQLDTGHSDSPVETDDIVPSPSPRIRTVPAAVTPVGPDDFLAGVHGHYRNCGRKEFRTRILSYLDGHSAGTYTSFRRALAACLLTLRSESDAKEVLIPSFCSSDYQKVITGIGLTPRRYDVDPQTLAADIDSLQSKSFDDALAVIAVNVLGYSSDMERLETVCTSQDVFLLEALGYGLGTEYAGRRLGTFGDCSILNFQQGKPIPIGGGMVVSQNPKLTFSDTGRSSVSPNIAALGGYMVFSYPSMYGMYRNGGERIASLVIGTDRPSTHPESKENVTYVPPFKTISNFQGEIGCRVFECLSEHRNQRAETAHWYSERLDGVDGISLLSPVAGLSNHPYVRYPLLVESQSLRKHLHEELVRVGIQSSMMYDWPVIDTDQFPGGATLQNRLLTVPTHPYVTERDRRRVVQSIVQKLSAVQ